MQTIIAFTEIKTLYGNKRDLSVLFLIDLVTILYWYLNTNTTHLWVF